MLRKGSRKDTYIVKPLILCERYDCVIVHGLQFDYIHELRYRYLKINNYLQAYLSVISPRLSITFALIAFLGSTT
jgi:hypothetical protein